VARVDGRTPEQTETPGAARQAKVGNTDRADGRPGVCARWRGGRSVGRMDPTTPPAGPRSSLAFARERDERVRWLLGLHPVTAAMLVDLGWFPTKRKALWRLGRLVKRRVVRIVGTVSRKPGRPEHVYCTFQPKQD